MNVFYIILLSLFLIFFSLYIFMSIRLSVLSKKKEKYVRSVWKEDDVKLVDVYRRSTRVSLKEIFLGLDNGKVGKK